MFKSGRATATATIIAHAAFVAVAFAAFFVIRAGEVRIVPGI